MERQLSVKAITTALGRLHGIYSLKVETVSRNSPEKTGSHTVRNAYRYAYYASLEGPDGRCFPAHGHFFKGITRNPTGR
jgi:hypothetical protein